MSNEPKIDLDEVQRIATLARLKLAPREAKEIATNLGDILKYMGQLNEVDTRGINPTSHAIALPTKYRADVASTGMPTTKVLRGAPERIGDGFGVPKIVE
ncbi:MAG: Asp-tRNA(Asn)/Glu-tRNA(Gln) amidotransferase subunit GatC [Myxococcota bacterium]|jgi:aspartyl-tRNA(Asn)/glutamyl-tRNA(Gln) amidotransferase subunit C|nr:Asp-tRNA(Asn)/Glu-tRNA(Gln) amidotransferase subunit GatC [Myxococcota bacterium]